MRPRSPSRWLHRALCVVGLLGLLVAGCVVSPQPEPPSIVASLLSIETSGGGVMLRGAAGAVTPGGSALDTLDLDGKAPAGSVTVAADGSFAIALAGVVTDAFRLQAFAGGLRSDPVDIASHTGLTGTPTLGLVTPPLAGCFTTAPALDIGPLAASSSTTVLLINGCASPVTVGAVSLRAGSPAFTLGAPATSLVMPPGSTSTFTVTFAPHAGDPVEDVVFVKIDAPETGRLALTVRGQSP
jgi:hypothetical protein